MPVPRWSQVTASPEWNQVTPEQQEGIRLGWLKSVLAENPDWQADKIKELISITQQHQPEGQPQEQVRDEAQAQANGQPIAPPPEVTADGNLDLSNTPNPPANSPVMQPAIGNNEVAPGEQAPPAISPPQGREQATGGMPSAQEFLSGTAKQAKELYDISPFASVAKGYEEDGIPGAIGRAIGYPVKVARGLIEDFTKRDALLKTVGTLNALQAGVAEGMSEKHQELMDTEWHKQEPVDRIRDIKETIKNDGFRTSWGGGVNPFDFGLPDQLRDIILNQDAAGRTPQQIDKIILDAIESGQLKDIPKVVGRQSTRKDKEYKLELSPSDNPWGALGVDPGEIIGQKGFRKGVIQSMQGKVVSMNDIRKVMKGNSYEERYGLANGIALSILADMMTDPLIVLSLPKQVTVGIFNKIAKGQTKQAYRILAGIMDGEKYAKEAERIKLLKRFKEKGHSQKFNLLQDSLEGAKNKGRKALPEPQKAITAGRSKVGRPSNVIENAAPGGKAIPLEVETGNRAVDRINKAIPLEAGAKEAVHKANQAIEKARISKPSLPAGKKGIELPVTPERKALTEGTGVGTPVHKKKIPLGSGGETTTRLRKTQANMQKAVGKRFTIDEVTDKTVTLTHAATGETKTIPVQNFTRRTLKTLDETLRRRSGLIKKKGKTIALKVESGNKAVEKITEKEAEKLVKDAGAVWKGQEVDEIRGTQYAVHHPLTGSTNTLSPEQMTKENITTWLKESYDGTVNSYNEHATHGVQGLAAKVTKLAKEGEEITIHSSKHNVDKVFEYPLQRKEVVSWLDDLDKGVKDKGVKIKPLKEPPKGGKKPIELGQGKIIDFPDKWKEKQDRLMKTIYDEKIKKNQLDKEQIENLLRTNRDYDQKMWNKGYRYRVDIPKDKGEPLYAKTLEGAKDLVKEYGTKGIKVHNLESPKLSTIKGGIETPKKPNDEQV